MWLLEKLNWAFVPDSQNFETVAWNVWTVVTREVVPLITVLLWGDVECWKLARAVKLGSRLWMLGPSWVVMPPPEPTAPPPPASPLAFKETPWRLTLWGPAARPAPTERRAPPALA